MLTSYYIEKLLGLKDIILDNVKEISGEMHIYIRMQQRVHICPKCQNTTSKVHDYRMQLVKDAPAFGNRTIIHLKKRRHVCPCCGKKFYETISFLPRYQHTTTRLWFYVLNALKETRSMKAIALECGISQTSVARIVDVLGYGMTNLPSVLSIDEFRGNSGGEKFQTIITNPKKKCVLDILPNRKQDDLCGYFGRFTNRNNVKIVSIDMSQSFRSTVKACFPAAEIVADKYHVVRQVLWAFENVRKRVQKEFSDYRRRYFKKSRRLLLKHENKLSREELEQVSIMLSISKDLALAYHLKNVFYDFMKSTDYFTAKKKLANWYLLAESINLIEYKKCINSFRNWETEILNAFKFNITNGFTEGSNNKIKVLKRVSYGMRNFPRFRKRILHSASI